MAISVQGVTQGVSCLMSAPLPVEELKAHGTHAILKHREISLRWYCYLPLSLGKQHTSKSGFLHVAWVAFSSSLPRMVS